MNIVEINTCNFGSTGNIMLQVAEIAKKRGHKVWMAYPKYKMNLSKQVDNCIYIGNDTAFSIHKKIAAYLGLNGCGSFFSTLRFLREIDRLEPDLIQLHNLHNCYINLPLLFMYLKKKNISVVWTLHDCWSMTGQCTYFDMVKCQKWKNGCYECQQIHLYPSSHVDQTRLMWNLKRNWFCGIKRLTLVTPSRWLAERVKESYLKNYPVQVIYNGIDLDVFKFRSNDIRKKYNIPDNVYILLGVAFGWGARKGLDVFIELSRRFASKPYQIILVGTDDKIDQSLPSNIISIHRTQNQIELAEIYSAADVFVNPTREEVLGLVNIEANACGTPVVTFNSGGSPECISERSGSIVDQDDIDGLEKTIIGICERKPFSRETCRRQAELFDMNTKFSEYLTLYEASHQK